MFVLSLQPAPDGHFQRPVGREQQGGQRQVCHGAGAPVSADPVFHRLLFIGVPICKETTAKALTSEAPALLRCTEFSYFSFKWKGIGISKQENRAMETSPSPVPHGMVTAGVSD